MTDKKLSYGSYLQLDRLLDSQTLKSTEEQINNSQMMNYIQFVNQKFGLSPFI